MATSGELVRIASKALRLPEVTVELHYRALRKGGLIQKGGRGRSARHVDPLDVARLLISLMTARIVREAPEAVRRFGRLQRQRSEVRPLRPPEPPSWLADGHLLEESLAGLLSTLSYISPSKAVLKTLRHVMVSINVDDVTADMTTPLGVLHYDGSASYRPERGLRVITSLGLHGLIRLSRAVMDDGSTTRLRHQGSDNSE